MIYNFYVLPQDQPAPDEHTLFLLHGEEIKDSSIYNVSLTNHNVVPSSLQKKFGNKSLYFDGESYLSMPKFNIKLGDFTIDWWEYLNSLRGEYQSIWAIEDQAPGFLSAYFNNRHTLWDIPWKGVDIGTVITRAWTHKAFIRNGQTFSLYINGQKTWNGTFAGAIAENDRFMLGARILNQTLSQGWAGYIDEFRISNIARWTNNFTPPTQPYNS